MNEYTVNTITHLDIYIFICNPEIFGKMQFLANQHNNDDWDLVRVTRHATQKSIEYQCVLSFLGTTFIVANKRLLNKLYFRILMYHDIIQ